MHLMRRWLMLSLLTVMGPGMALAQPAPPVVPVPVCDQAPRIDGALDDACWRRAYRSESFHDFELAGGDFAPNADTTLRLTRDASWLYFGLECRHPIPTDMKASVTENYGGRVFGDECIKFFIMPGVEGGGYFRYVLNFRNIFELSRSFTAAESTPQLAWPSATRLTAEGWAAEVAVPLFYLAGYADLSGFRLNVFRKKIVKEYDAQHVEVGFHEFISAWAATDEWLNPDEMARLEGLTSGQMISPFVANADHVAVGSLYEADGGVAYDVTMTLMAMTGKAGQVLVEVVETPLEGEQRRVAETVALEPGQVMQAKVAVPVQTLGQREIEVRVSDAITGMPFQTVQIADTSGFRMLSAMTRRNYYTSESEAGVVYSVGMPAQALADRRVVVRDAAGAELARLDAPPQTGELPLPLGALREGSHALALALEGQDGRRVSEVSFELVKLPPKPGCEWKVDRLTGSLLYGGEPFFPMGFLVGLSDEQYAEIAEAGFNTVVWWMDTDGVPFTDAMEMAARHGLKIMVRPEKAESRAAEMETLKRYFEGAEYQQALAGCRSMIGLKGFLLTPLARRLTRAQRNEISAEFFDLHLPAVLENVRSVRDLPALLGYDTLDEPVFETADQYVELRRMYLAIKETDPYHPQYALYSSSIPPGPEATSFGDCLGTDPYWTPGRPLPRGSINWMSQTTARTVARALEVGQHPWTVPQSSLWSDVIKRMLTGPEQICQCYLALIHGTRSLLWFTHGWVVTQEQWEALKTVGEHVNALTPALTAESPAQQISYRPGTWDPIKGELPDVQARLFGFPDGRRVLLAANVRRSAVQVAVRIEGLRDAQARDMFAGPIGAIEGGAFSDTLPARGVRAYAFDRIEAEGPVQVVISITPLGEEGPIEDGYRHEGRVGMRNIQPNPSFEEATVTGFPDYYWPFDWTAGRIGWRHRVGTPDASLILAEGGAFHGERFLRTNPYDPEIAVGIYLRSVAPQHAAPQPYVLSFYARTDAAEPVTVSVKAFGRNLPAVKVEGAQWTRHHVQLEVPAHADSHSWLLISSSGRVDLDALQFEQGREPTEFQP